MLDIKTPCTHTHHVRRGEITHHKLILVLLHQLGHLVRHALHAHLRLLVVRRHLRARDHEPLLVLELLLDAAVEEERDVRVLLRLCDVRLLDPGLGERLREHVRHRLWWERDGEGELRVVLGHGGDVLRKT